MKKTKAQWINTVAGLSADAEMVWINLLASREGSLMIEGEIDSGATLAAMQELIAAGLAEAIDSDDQNVNPETPGADLVISEAYMLEVGR